MQLRVFNTGILKVRLELEGDGERVDLRMETGLFL